MICSDKSIYYNIAKAPLYYVRSGYMTTRNGALMQPGLYGTSWSSRAYSDATNAWHVSFGPVERIGLIVSNARIHAFPLRGLYSSLFGLRANVG